MVTGFALVCLAAVTAFAGGTVVASFAADAIRATMQSARVQHRASSEDFVHRRLRAGYRALEPLSARLLALAPVCTWFQKCRSVLCVKGYVCTDQSLCTFSCVWAMVLFVLSSLMGGSWVFGAATVGCTLTVLSAVASRILETRRQSMRESLPDALRAMGVCFHAGFTLQQTFAQLQRECSGPLRDIFAKASQSIKLGESAEASLSKLQGADSVPELAFVSVALAVQHQAGGSMRQVLDSTCESLESELELRRSLKVHTAQARLSARVVTGVTIALVAVLSLVSHDFLQPFFQSVPGAILLCVALAMQVAGVLVVRRMLNVEMD